MKILEIRPETGAGHTLARFNAQITDDIRMFNLKLVATPDGRRVVYAPNAFGEKTATFGRHLAADLARAASAALIGAKALDRTNS